MKQYEKPHTVIEHFHNMTTCKTVQCTLKAPEARNCLLPYIHIIRDILEIPYIRQILSEKEKFRICSIVCLLNKM